MSLRSLLTVGVVALLAGVLAAPATAGTWGAPVNVSGVNGQRPNLAIDGTGATTLVWRNSDGSNDRIYWSRYERAGGVWGWTSQATLSDGGLDAGAAAVASSPSGVVTAVWWRDNGSEKIIQARRYVSGAWSSPAADLSIPGLDAYSPVVATDASGNATVVYTRNNEILATRWDGAAWTAPVAVSTSAVGYVRDGEYGVAVDAAGVSTIVWLEGADYTTVQAKARRCSLIAGALSCGSTNVLSEAGKRAFQPQVAVDSAGNAMAVWAVDVVAGSDRVVKASRYAGAAWGGAATLSTSYQASEPKVVGGDAGVFQTLWYAIPTNGSSDYTMEANRFDGSAWGGQQVLQTIPCGSGSLAPRPGLSMTPGGVAMAVWVYTYCPIGTTPASIRTAQSTNGTWGTPETLKTYPYPDDAFNTSVAVNADGMATAAWYGGSPRYVTTASYAVAPGAPTGVAGTRGNGQVTVNWSAPAGDGGSAITGYTVEQASGGSYSAATTAACSPAADTCRVVTGLANGTAYTFRVTASNAVGPGSASSPSAAVTPATVPGAPTGVAGTRGDGQVTVNWSAPSTGGSAITGYAVTGSPAGSCTAVAPATTCTVTGLVNGTSYTFTVTATNAVGVGPASTASAEVVPVAPRAGGGDGAGDAATAKPTTTIEVSVPVDGEAAVTVEWSAREDTAATTLTTTLPTGVAFARSATRCATARKRLVSIAVPALVKGERGRCSYVVRTSRPSVVLTVAGGAKASSSAGASAPGLPASDWVRAVLAILERGTPRATLNQTLDGVRLGTVTRDAAAATIRRDVLAVREGQLRSANALAAPPASLARAERLLRRSLVLSAKADRAYIAWLEGDPAQLGRAITYSLLATSAKARLLTALGGHGVAIPPATTTWP